MERDLDLDAFDFFELGVDVVDAADQGPQLGDGQRRGRIGLHRNRNNFVPADLELILKHEGVPGLTQTPELKINRAPRPPKTQTSIEKESQLEAVFRTAAVQ